MKPKVDDQFIIDTNRKCYDNLGELYTDGKGDLETLLNMGVWRDFLSGLSGRKVLDVGCGAGDATKWLVDNKYEVTACDLSEEMIKTAQQKTNKARFLTLGATELEKLDDRFDGIISVHLVQHLSKIMMKKFFGDVYNLLVDGGKFLLVFTNTCYEKTGYQLDGEKDGNYIFWHKWQMDDIVPLLAKAKLKPIFAKMQKGADNSCAIDMEPFVFICERSN
jgi:2-polyprenyl-3-methyl-5-hydroxy-6-metoxy-1,4-benzoquinol methylase